MAPPAAHRKAPGAFRSTCAPAPGGRHGSGRPAKAGGRGRAARREAATGTAHAHVGEPGAHLAEAKHLGVAEQHEGRVGIEGTEEVAGRRHGRSHPARHAGGVERAGGLAEQQAVADPGAKRPTRLRVRRPPGGDHHVHSIRSASLVATTKAPSPPRVVSSRPKATQRVLRPRRRT